MGMDCIFAASFTEAKQVVEKERSSIFLSLIDLNMIDAKGVEHIDYMLQQKIEKRRYGLCN